MKKLLIVALSALLVLGLVACGSSQAESEPTAEPTQAPTEAPAAEPTAQPTEAPTEEPTQAPEEESDPVQDTIDLVLSMKGQPIEDLYAAIGEPNGSDYASSCLVDGQDGMLYYDGFTVYTLAPNDGQETVYDCEPAA